RRPACSSEGSTAPALPAAAEAQAERAAAPALPAPAESPVHYRARRLRVRRSEQPPSRARRRSDSSSQPFSYPTGDVKGFATTSLPSTILSGSAGSARGAGPSTTRPPCLGSNDDEWHEHDRICSAASQSSMSQPLCVQMAV